MRIVLATILVAATSLSFACGGSDKNTPPPLASAPATTAVASSPTRAAAANTAVPATIAVATPPAAATIAAPTAAAAPPTAAPQATEAAPEPTTAPPPPPPASGGAATIVALNLAFDTSSLSAATGPVAVTLNNQDSGIAHNIHFFSKSGSIGMTDIETGPSTQTLSLGTLAPGAYSFKCDVHPTTMKGILTVS